MIPIAIIVVATAAFFVLERVLPARELPEAPGWYARSVFLSSCQIGIVVLAGVAWNRWLQGWSLFHISHRMPAWEQGLLGWLIGTFVFYWWHRARHDVDFLWRVCHQIHHSPSRIELLTAFYKHPVEIVADSMLSSVLMFSLLGASLEAALWFNVFAVVGEYFYHSNLKTPRWVGYFIQRPEHHSIHHQVDVHGFNYGDITLWDRLFGTFRETDDFVERCGFPEDHEKHLCRMLLFHDCY
ncbi:MAG TPA: sterol desaturase family protein [Candidatus Acidoferrales bacterium]|jgi:sterol desaturase/sphingolipid hydroxylase (fatty acid hydroxylase superfamily)|nr:sterol desaturase family protein [Candidatus Acidoferrales bacterium]